MQSAGAGGEGAIIVIYGFKFVGAASLLSAVLMAAKKELISDPEAEEGLGGKGDADP